MARTTVEVDKTLVERVMLAYGIETTREAVDLALRELVGAEPRRTLALQGSGWHGDLEELRGRHR
jgi:Arc/MetJ family transcription regulator